MRTSRYRLLGADLADIFPWHLLGLLVAAASFLLIGAICVYAQDATPVATSSGLLDLVLSHVVDVVYAAIAAVVGWLISKIVALLGITDQATRLKVEGQLRDALHFCAENALKYAFAKLGLPPSLTPSPEVLADAIAYVQSNNPDTIKALGVTEQALKQIILSKVPTIASWTALATPLIGEASATTTAPAAAQASP
ncbi:hypothetical protein HB780_05530 (plasmid) [Rhizobium lusitanum]|uniref:hypothetical protein n=1 Tax=Rhizobium lusitanum TaxID=293958 RepID=UPI00161B83E4|nr:hypothetical protein [Rhizobium lusitanum]QND45216.1 hypothetical protein HB780_05530 [Rhizobium lusitanum]